MRDAGWGQESRLETRVGETGTPGTPFCYANAAQALLRHGTEAVRRTSSFCQIKCGVTSIIFSQRKKFGVITALALFML
uniref:Uncharacterized protein n=1 Tax=Triticum urartu TaxID=4572 RepID=A0A8R7PYI2_TRIUA